jgi:LacI family transcriptional regulator
MTRQLPLLRPAVFRARFEQWNAEEGAAELDRIGQRGSHGVVLKARDVPLIVAAVDRLAEAGIPVVTLATDLPASRRAAYVGVDNRSAGATAAYLINQMGIGPGTVAVTVSNDFFRGEEEREMGFRAAMRAMDPGRDALYLPGRDGLDHAASDERNPGSAPRPVIARGGRNYGGSRSRVQDRLSASSPTAPQWQSSGRRAAKVAKFVHHPAPVDVDVP